ncbi:MAG: ABC transporter permease [Saccharofermentans sp.]|jgi:ABC-2 type transport system permease protein|nr:ABC transporter permease [Mageeibacillus sp.]MCI1264648.1 ABC transporter permease [Saccharofermentans sp.]MCI1274632.1 ABC transporter permease [Saccharofermentans sp.]
MHLYKNFFALIKRHWQGLVIYSAISLIMLGIMFSQGGLGTDSTTFEGVSYNIAYVDEDNSDLSRALISYLSKSNSMTDCSDKSAQSVAHMVFLRLYSYEITIPAGFGASSDLIINYYTGTDGGWSTYSINSMIDSYLNLYSEYLKLGMTVPQACAAADSALSSSAEVEVLSSGSDSSAEDIAKAEIVSGTRYYAFLALGMLALSCGTVVMVSSREEIASRIDVAPVKKSTRTVANYMGILTCGIGVWLAATVIQVIVGAGTEFLRTYGVVIILNTFAVTLVVCAISICLASLNLEDQSYSMCVNLTDMVLAFLGGLFVPLQYLGDNIIAVSRFTPYYWFSCINSMAEGTYDFSYVKFWACLGMQLLFAVLIFAVAILINTVRHGSNVRISLIQVRK